jgi:hypothetical protein
MQGNQTRIEGKKGIALCPLPRAAPRLPWAIYQVVPRGLQFGSRALRRWGSACDLEATTSNFEEGISKVREGGIVALNLLQFPGVARRKSSRHKDKTILAAE